MLKSILAAALVVTAATGLTTTHVFAADLALKAPPAAPINFTWTGCFIGAHAGGVQNRDTLTNALGNQFDYNSAWDFIGGGQIGCDKQFATNWVVGAEGRAAWTTLDNTYNASVRFAGLGNLVVPSRLGIKNDFLASATVRLGYVYAERWLVYARGGAAWTREKFDDAFIGPVVGFATDPNASASRDGWTAGAGAEWAFAPHWSANVEYDYYNFGTKGILLVSPVNRVTLDGVKDTIQAATLGVNYHFWDGPTAP